MFFKTRKGEKIHEISNRSLKTFDEFLSKNKMSSDFLSFAIYKGKEDSFYISYYKTLVKEDFIHRDILLFLKEKSFRSLEEIKSILPIESMVITNNLDEVQENLLNGFITIYSKQFNADSFFLLIPSVQSDRRQITVPEVEYGIIGPKEAFVESLQTNLNLIRKRLPILGLKSKEVYIGEVSKTKVAILYIDGISNNEYVNTTLQRINNITYDQIIDSSYISQLVTDNPNSLFPQIFDTERPDRVANLLSEGKIAILVDGSPHALIVPTNIFEFFSSFEDYFFNWITASIFRLMRLISVFITVLLTPLYVAVLTFHYEMIPDELLTSLISSRSDVPFPPIIEVLILEIAIELLRESAKRLPNKIGQTMGIVGGIVIGTATVEAAITSNVLLIIVAIAALASFTTPAFQMSNTIRLIRFPFLAFAQLLGLFGISICAAFLLGHLLKLTSLGRPYLEPIYPFRSHDMKDSIYRLPLQNQTTRPLFLRPGESIRMIKRYVKGNQDIDD